VCQTRNPIVQSGKIGFGFTVVVWMEVEILVQVLQFGIHDDKASQHKNT
jgi:hypothetical protein